MVRGPLKHNPIAHLTCGIHTSILIDNLNVTHLFLIQLIRIINAPGFFHPINSKTVNPRLHNRTLKTGDRPIKGPVPTYKATQKTRQSSTSRAEFEHCVRLTKCHTHFRSLEHSILIYARMNWLYNFLCHPRATHKLVLHGNA